jgi:hypothetical protein
MTKRHDAAVAVGRAAWQRERRKALTTAEVGLGVLALGVLGGLLLKVGGLVFGGVVVAGCGSRGTWPVRPGTAVGRRTSASGRPAATRA